MYHFPHAALIASVAAMAQRNRGGMAVGNSSLGVGKTAVAVGDFPHQAAHRPHYCDKPLTTFLYFSTTIFP